MEKNMADPRISDMLDFVIDGKVNDLQTVVDDYMKDKVSDILTARKVEVAKTIFNSPEG